MNYVSTCIYYFAADAFLMSLFRENSLKKFAALELVDMKISLKKSKWDGKLLS